MSQNLTSLFKLIQSNASLMSVQEFLKNKDLPHSAGSWSDMFTKRLEPGLANNTVHVEDLHNLLREAEEHGAQHIFLFKCSATRAAEFCSHENLSATLTNLGLEALLNGPKILEMPDSPTIVDVRIESESNKKFLIVKIAETRTKIKQESSTTVEDKLVKVYVPVNERSSSVARLSSEGILEIRIASKDTKDQYTNELMAFRHILAPFLDFDIFHEVSLGQIKNLVYKEHEALSDIICVSQSRFRNSQGNSILAATGDRKKHLADDKGINDSIEKFTTSSVGTYCEHSNLWFNKIENQSIPSKEIHVVISGKVNEFSIGSKCSRQDYEYVLNTVWELNQRVSE